MTWLLFDEISFDGKPWKTIPGAREIFRGTNHHWFKRRRIGGDSVYDTKRGYEPRVRQTAREALSRRQPLVIDIEAWKVQRVSSVIRYESITKYQEVCGWIRDEAPGVRFGPYRYGPLMNWPAIVPYKRAMRDIEAGRSTYWTRTFGRRAAHWKSWLAGNVALAKDEISETGRAMEGLVDMFDFLTPNLYCPYSHPREIRDWPVYADAVITEARKYQKQLYPYITPYLKDDGTQMSGSFMKQILDFCWDRCDGAIIWNRQKRSGPVQLTEGWFPEVINFIQEKGLVNAA